MRKYERELIERCLDVLQDAVDKEGDARSAAVRLALWALRPYCTADALSRFWTTCESQNPMWAAGARLAAFNLVRSNCAGHRNAAATAE